MGANETKIGARFKVAEWPFKSVKQDNPNQTYTVIREQYDYRAKKMAYHADIGGVVAAIFYADEITFIDDHVTVLHPDVTKSQEKQYNKGKELDADTVIRDLVAFMDEVGIEHVSVKNAKKYLDK